MADPATELTRPRGRYGVDGDFRLIPAPVAFAGYLRLLAGERAGLGFAAHPRWALDSLARAAGGPAEPGPD